MPRRPEEASDVTQMQTISFSVTPLVAANLAKRAAPLNIRTSEYARRLFDAAYHARVLQERGEPAMDAELDEQVRKVFLLADCEPEFIAEAIGLPLPRVQTILDGWRTVAREIADGTRPAAAPAPSTPPSPASPPAAPAQGGGYPVETIRTLWAEGKGVREIAGAIGKTEGAMSVWASKNRDVCPKRRQRGEA
jgi:hypothetical protein